MNYIFDATFLPRHSWLVDPSTISWLFKHFVIVLANILRMNSPMPIGLTPGFLSSGIS